MCNKEREKKKSKSERHSEWLIVQRSIKTRKPVRSFAVDPKVDVILDRQDNVSQFINKLVLEWAERQKGVYLIPAQEEVCDSVDRFFLQFQFLPTAPRGDERWAEEINEKISTEILDFIEEDLGKRLEEEGTPALDKAVKLVEKAREDREFWLKLYKKIRAYRIYQEVEAREHRFGRG